MQSIHAISYVLKLIEHRMGKLTFPLKSVADAISIAAGALQFIAHPLKLRAVIRPLLLKLIAQALKMIFQTPDFPISLRGGIVLYDRSVHAGIPPRIRGGFRSVPGRKFR
jgi:hypothetical protein